MESEQTFPATIESMPDCQRFLDSICESPRPQIIMDEIVSNIVRCSGATAFTIRVEHVFPNGVVSMTFEDDGSPFDPTTEIVPPDVTATAETRPIGGLGMFMVKKMSKAVSYRRENDRNKLSVTL